MGGRGQKFSIPKGGAGFDTGGVRQAEPETMKEALGTKGKPMSIGEATVGTNPYYSYSYREYSENCQRCVVAYEMRRRGYDVTAQSTFRGDKLPAIAKIDEKRGIFHAYWRGAFQHAKTENVSAKGVEHNTKAAEAQVISNIEAKMREYGNGSRAVIQILYRGGGGHVFNVENDNGRIVYVEAQAGTLKNFNRTMSHVKTDAVNIVRVDNLRPSERIKKSVIQIK